MEESARKGGEHATGHGAAEGGGRISRRARGGHSTHSHGGDCPPPEARTAQAATEAAQAVRKGPSEYPNYPEGPAPILSHGTS